MTLLEIAALGNSEDFASLLLSVGAGGKAGFWESESGSRKTSITETVGIGRNKQLWLSEDSIFV